MPGVHRGGRRLTGVKSPRWRSEVCPRRVTRRGAGVAAAAAADDGRSVERLVLQAASMTATRNRTLARLAICVLLLGPGACGHESAPAPDRGAVPAEFQDLYGSLQATLDSFNRTLDARGSGTRTPVTFSAELLTANANRGQQLLGSDALPGARLELDRLRALGVRGVVFTVSFPLLYPPFHAWSHTDPAPYLAFYRQVAAEARARGLKVAIGTGPMFRGVYSAGAGFDVGAYYDQLSTDEYLFGRGEVAKAIARDLQPDFLELGGEPDSEAEISGKPVNSPFVYLTLTNYLLDQLGSVEWPGRVGVGVGSWHPLAPSFVRGYCTSSRIDFVDVHVYPISLGFLQQALSLSDTARACGKGVAISEAWLLKARDTELRQTSNAVDPSLFARDAYGFWAPLDASFLSTMVKLAYVTRAELLSAFWSRYFFAYLDYDTVARDGCGTPRHACAPAEVLDLASAAAARSIVAGDYTSTGRAYMGQIAP